MKVNVKKLNGNSEPLDIGKILKWGEWACADSPNVSFESILAATEASFYDGVETAEINLAICTQCEIMAMVSAQEEDYQLVEEYTHIARNLYIPTLLKKSNYFQSKYLTSDDILEGGEFKLTDTNIVPLPRYKLKSIIRLGVELDTYDPALLDGSISDELFEYADSLLDYSYMNNLKFGGMRQFEGKYLRRIDGHLLEDPLQLQLLVALAAVRSDITFHPNCKTIEGQKEALENYYRLNRNVEQNLPTPFLLCFRTNSKTYDSCCFLPGALIDSPLGSIPIEAIEKDFLVYNENGNIVKVNQPTSRQYSGNVYSLNTILQPTDSWYVTADHKLRVKSGTNKYCWREAKDILNDDFLYVPYIKENTQEIYPISFLSDSFEVEDNKIFRNKGKPSTPVLNTELKNNPMFYRLLGYFAGDGHTASNRHVYFTLGKAKIYIDDIKNIVRDIFNIDCKVIDNQHLDSTVSVKIHSVVIKKLFNDIIGNNSKDKSDYLNFIQSGSKDCLKQFIVGYFRTDGCAFHSGYTLSSTNKNLINILKQCLLKLNYVPSITKRVRVTNYSTDKESVLYSLTLVMPKSDPLVLAINRDTYKITKTTQHRHRIQFITSGCFVPIRSINYKYVDTTVYDFAVDCDTHSFTIDGIAVHNCLVNMGDTNPSIRATQTVIGEATEAGAGLGVNMGRIRSKGTRFKKMGKHQGLLGYLGLSSKNLKANNQESRGGSGTINVPIWTRDFYDLVMLKDVTGVEGENRYRHLDYCFSFSMYLVEKIRKNEKILLASPHTLLPSGKTIYEAFFTNFPEGGYDDSEFIAFCEEKLKDPNIPYVNNENSGTGKAGSFAYTYALDMFLTLCRQMINTGRIYTFNATHVNNHSSFLSPIEMTNLCVEILQPTSPPSYQYSSKEHTIIPNDGEVSFCQLGGLVMSPTVTKEELPRIAYWMLRFQEAVFNTSEYSKISFSQKQKDRRNIGIGLVNYQYLLVREVYSKYPESEWVSRVAEVTHDWYEAIQFNLIKANIKLAQELGPCGLASDSKYSKGILPIDHYYKTKLTDFPLKQDWESLRPLAIKYGVRFSTITALMPVESSSVIYNLISGIDFPRKPAVYKGNKVLSVLVTVPEIAKYGKHYVYAWNKYKSFDINELYLAMCANITKFLDQSISYNNYIKYSNFEGNKVPEEYMLETFILGPAYNGIKTTYYINFDSDLTVKDENEDDKKLQKELTEEEKEFQEQLRILELKQVEEGGIACSSGSCAL